MTSQHPLTDDMLKQIQSENPMRIYGTQAMRAAYDVGRDWQLEQVIEWLDENLCDYNTGTESCPGFFWPMSRLTVDLKRAMRPTTTQKDS